MTRPLVLGLDVGGTSMKGAVLDRDLGMVVHQSFPTPVDRGPDAVVAAIGDALEALSATDGGLGTVRAVGVGVPGLVDDDRGTAVFAANLGWRDVPLAETLAKRTGLAVSVGHDIRVGALAEAVAGAGRGVSDLLFLAVGTGIGGALLVDGRPLVAGGYAGEIGHLQVDPGGELCGCGGRGCLERVASAAAIARTYTRRSGRTVHGAADVAAAVRSGDAVARAVWDEAVAALATALVTTATLFAPERILVGGGLSESGELLLDPLAERVAAGLSFQRRPEIARAALGDAAGCVGAGVLAWRRLGERLP